jgi:hypothetical protein
MVHVAFDCAGGIPLARREVTLTRQRLAARALELGLVKQVGEIGISVDDADQVGYGSRGLITSLTVPYDSRLPGHYLRPLGSSANHQQSCDSLAESS